MALTVVALTIVYKGRLSPAKGARKLKREGGQREESAREEKIERQPVLKSSSGRDIHKRAISSGEKPLKPAPVANEVPKQAQPKNTAPVKSSAPIKPVEVPKQVQPKNTVPVKDSEPMAASKDGSVRHTAFVGPPQPQAAFTISRNGEKPNKEASAGNKSGGEINQLSGTVEPAITNKSEAGMDTEPDTEVNQAGSEPSAETTDSGETDQETPQTNKSGLGDLADLFATSAADFSEKNRLAEQVDDVDVNDILQEGLGLLGKIKKSDD
jgi:hypothetical protein